ncbi:MAG: ribosomal RNA small subunit methyltransferase A [Spirochaetaceae bacterium]|nr:MAG: ribosomal RNA small subunit methyltransferase A [Spirochaetaceae bacterium]
MNHDSISEIRALLEDQSIALKKRFGQNFLTDGTIRARLGELIRDAVALPGGDTGEVWEIGPGLGALTDQLRPYQLPLRLFEIDHGMIRILRNRYGDSIPIEAGDFLDTFPALLNRLPAPPVPRAIVGNLPYHSAGAIIPRIVEEGIETPVMVFLLQKEMVDRLSGAPGTADYSALSVLVQTHYHVLRKFSVPATAFYPRPRVGSAVALFRQRPDRPDRSLARTISLVTRTAFAQRRKILRNTLRDYLPQLEACGISALLRPEQLAPEEFAAIARACQEQP